MRFKTGLSVVMVAGIAAQMLMVDAGAAKVYRQHVSKSSEKSTLHKVLAVPAGAVGAVVGVGIGAPVRALKGIGHDTPRMVHSVRHDMKANKGAKKALATTIGAPLGVVTGAARGSVEGVGKGLEYGYRKPLSKASTGLHK